MEKLPEPQQRDRSSPALAGRYNRAKSPVSAMIAVPHSISPDEYLDIERQNPIRHEYRRGL